MSVTHTAPLTYKALPGRGPRRRGLAAMASRCRLYLAADHLLSVDNHGFSEDYKRFYLSDILAVMIFKDDRWLGWSIALGIPAALCLLGALSRGGGGFAVFLSVSGALFALLLLVHLMKGATCTCSVVTAVQTEHLPSLHRVRTARKAIALLKNAIEPVQGAVEPAVLVSGLSAAPATARRIRTPLRSVPKSKGAIRHYGGSAHLIAFCMLLADGLISAASFIHHTATLSLVSVFCNLGYSLFIVIALVKQRGTDIPAAAHKITWLSLVFIWLAMFIGNITGFFIYSAHYAKNPPRTPPDQWELFRMMLDIAPTDSVYLTIIAFFGIVSSLGLSAFGLNAIIRHRRSSRIIAAQQKSES